MISIRRTTSADADFQYLVGLLDQEALVRDGADNAFYAQFNKIDAIQHALVGYVEKQPVGCGAFKPFNAETAEIKRMFVTPEHRGKGAAGEILKQLEMWAAEAGYTVCVLETGKKQPEAIALYSKSGYAVIPNYGQYAGVENSVCFRKERI